jgi:hypothetical protein
MGNEVIDLDIKTTCSERNKSKGGFMNMKKLILALIIAVAVGLLPATGAMATAPGTNVTVTAVPSYISISNSPSAWTINGISGSGVISTNTTYYSNPLGDITSPSATVADGECRFTVTNNSTVPIDLSVIMTDFTGGEAMTNGETGSANVTGYGGYAWASGATYASGKQILKKSGSSPIKVNLAANTNIKWGMTITTKTNAWTSGTTETATATITAVYSVD